MIGEFQPCVTLGASAERIKRPIQGLLRGDCGWGSEANMSRAEREGLPYLFKLRLTRNTQRLIHRAMTEPGGLTAGHGWQGKEGNLRLQGLEPAPP